MTCLCLFVCLCVCLCVCSFYENVVNIRRPSLAHYQQVVNIRSFWFLILLVFIQVLYVTMVYGPIAAFLVEMFPTAIRYTSMSLPYHIGNGIFGGLLPAVATYLAAKASTANEVAVAAGQAIPYDKPYLEGLWYPIIIGGVCFVIGLLYVNGKDKEIND